MSVDRATMDHKLGHVTPAECASMRLLAEDGWTPGELKMTFQVMTTDSVARHVDGECTHNLEVDL